MSLISQNPEKCAKISKSEISKTKSFDPYFPSIPKSLPATMNDNKPSPLPSVRIGRGVEKRVLPLTSEDSTRPSKIQILPALSKNTFRPTFLNLNNGPVLLPPRDSSMVHGTILKNEREHSPGLVTGRDDFWESLRSNYNYLMDDALITSCKEASDELSLKEHQSDQPWSFTEFIQKFNELHDALHKLMSDILIPVDVNNDANIQKRLLDQRKLVEFGCMRFKEQSQQLGLKYPGMKDEISRRVNLLYNKWEALELAINPHKSLPQEVDFQDYQEVAHEVRCLRRWLHELEIRLENLTANPSWELFDLEETFKEQLSLQKEIQSRGKLVSSLLKHCECLDVGTTPGNQGDDHTSANDLASVLNSAGETRNKQQALPWDGDRFRKVAANLEKRFHALWLKSLEKQFVLEDIIQKRKDGKIPTEQSSFFGEEPVTKIPRLNNSGYSSGPIRNSRRRILAMNLTEPDSSSPTFSSTSSDLGVRTPDSPEDLVLNKTQVKIPATTDRGIMVGTTGIAQLKADCGGGPCFGRFEIIQDVGYSSESSTQLSNDERSDFMRIYSYSPAELGRTLLTEYKVKGRPEIAASESEDKDVLSDQGDEKLDPSPDAKTPMETFLEDPIMDWEFTSEDEDDLNTCFPVQDEEHVTRTRRPTGGHIIHSSPRKSYLQSVYEDIGGDLEWANQLKNQLEYSSISNINLLDASDELETSAITLVNPNDTVLSTKIVEDISEDVPLKNRSFKEESRKRTANHNALQKLGVKTGSPPSSKLSEGREIIKKSSRVKEWLRGCHPSDLMSSNLESNEEDITEDDWPASLESCPSQVHRKCCHVQGDFTRTDSCDASGEYTTNDSSCEEDGSARGTESLGEELRGEGSLAGLSRSGTGSVETVIPYLGRYDDVLGIQASVIHRQGARVVLRSKKRGGVTCNLHGERPWSVSELQLAKSGANSSSLSTSEGALNTLRLSSSTSSVRSKLIRDSSPPKSNRNSAPHLFQLHFQTPIHPTYSSHTLPSRRTRRNRSRGGSLHLSPTSPQAPSQIGTVTTDSGSEGLSPHSSQGTQQLVSDSAHYSSSTTTGLVSAGSFKHSGSSGSWTHRRRKNSPSKKANQTNGRKKNSPKTSNTDLSQMKTVPISENLESRVLKTPNVLVGYQSSVSDQVWDGYEDPLYPSEVYSETTIDEEQVKNLLNFGDDYGACIGSNSDTSSANGSPVKDGVTGVIKTRSSTVLCPEPVLDDSDSDVEELQHIMKESRRTLYFAEDSIKEADKELPPTEYADLLATCQTNLKCLQVIAEHLDEGHGHKSFSSGDIFHLQELIGGWEMLQSSVLSNQTNGHQYKDIQKEIIQLRENMEELTKINNDTCRPCLGIEDIEKRIATLQGSLSTLQETKATLLAVNLKVHRLLTEAGLTLSGLKDDVTDLYCQWDDIYEQSCTQLSELHEVHGTWVKFNQNKKILLDLLDEPMKENDFSENQVTHPFDPYRYLADLTTRSQKSQEILISLHQSVKTLEPHFRGESEQDGLWSILSSELEVLGSRVKHLQKEAIEACDRQSGKSKENHELNLAIDDLQFNTVSSSTPISLVEPIQRLQISTPKSITKIKGKCVNGVKKTLPIKAEPKKPRRSRFWRIMRAALPIQVALVVLYCLAWLMEPRCCDVLNNLNFSFTPTLRYVKGPPPV